MTSTAGQANVAVPAIIGPQSTKYLDDRAAESFKRQTDLEESIWRSLPLFTGALIAAGTIVAKAVDALPPLHQSGLVVVTYGSLCVAVLAFLWASLQLFIVSKPREFAYPADDADIAAYAEEVHRFYQSDIQEADDLDEEVLRELRAYMGGTFAIAAKSTFRNNQVRLAARSQALLFLVIGYLFAFVCDATISVHGLFERVKPHEVAAHVQAGHEARNPKGIGKAASADSATNAGHSGRGVPDPAVGCVTDKGQVSERSQEAGGEHAYRAKGRSPVAAAYANGHEGA